MSVSPLLWRRRFVALRHRSRTGFVGVLPAGPPPSVMERSLPFGLVYISRINE